MYVACWCESALLMHSDVVMGQLMISISQDDIFM